MSDIRTLAQRLAAACPERFYVWPWDERIACDNCQDNERQKLYFLDLPDGSWEFWGPLWGETQASRKQAGTAASYAWSLEDLAEQVVQHFESRKAEQAGKGI